MIIQVTDMGSWVEVEEQDGGTYYYLEGFVVQRPGDIIVRKFDGFGVRLHSPGFMDSTDWCVGESLPEAVKGFLGTWGDELTLPQWEQLGQEIPNFDEFLKGYLLAMGFTASNSDGDPLFYNPGGDIREVMDEGDVWKLLSMADRVDVLSDCINFYLDAIKYLVDDEAEDAGADFHYTRNGHGTGFWDGDWPIHGNRLTELAKPYGTAELHGWLGGPQGRIAYAIHN